MSGPVSGSGLVSLYWDEQRRILDEFPVEVAAQLAEWLIATYEAGGTVYAMANGGNAGTLDHYYCDFRHHPFVSEDKDTQLPGTIPRLSFVNLSGSPAELTGLVNDLGADEAYAAALRGFVTERDLVMAFSGSGNSANVLRALQVAEQAGARTFAMAKGDGGQCAVTAQLCLIVPGDSAFPGQTGKNNNNFHFEDMMLSLNHILVGILKDHVRHRNRLAAAGAGPAGRTGPSRWP